jgi:hypothetical protein
MPFSLEEFRRNTLLPPWFHCKGGHRLIKICIVNKVTATYRKFPDRQFDRAHLSRRQTWHITVTKKNLSYTGAHLCCICSSPVAWKASMVPPKFCSSLTKERRNTREVTRTDFWREPKLNVLANGSGKWFTVPPVQTGASCPIPRTAGCYLNFQKRNASPI